MKGKTFSRFKKLVKPYWKTIIFVGFLSLIINFMELAKPFIVQQVIDNYLKNRVAIYNNISLTMMAVIYISIVMGENIIEYIGRCISFNLGEKVIFDLRQKLFYFVENTNFKYHDKTPSGTLYVRVTSDTDDVYALFTDVLTTLPKNIIVIIGLLVAMFFISRELSIINVFMIVLLSITAIAITKAMNKIFERTKIARTKLNIFLAESIYGAKLIKIFNRQKEKQKECDTRTREHRDSARGLGVLFGILPGAIELIENLAISAIVVFCTYKFLGINLEVGIIYLFISYLKKLIAPINMIIENMETVTDALTSLNKIYDILEKEEYLEDFDSGIVLKNVKGRIEFKNVWFAYENEDWVLKDVSFTIEPGESAALVGKTGSGKTTITALISRFYEIQKGEILLDGINIKDINLRSLRANIGTILQDPFIYARSLKDNIKMYSDISDEDINQAVKHASADKFINTLPNGIDEIARERGSSYSAGQKQLIAFARIFAKNPSIFILDEATANIDTITEELIQKSVDKLSSQKTSIFIAHRLATIVNVDKIIVLNNGKIIEQGNHHELLNKNGYYANLYNSYYESLT